MKASEIRLIALAGVASVLVAGAVASQRMLAWQRQLDRRERDAQLLQLETEALLAEAPDWTEKTAWLDGHQPTATQGDLEANRELDLVVGNARDLGLTVQSKQLQETVRADHFYQVGVTLTVKGELSKVVGWLHGLLSPAQFRVVPHIKILPDKESPSEVIVSVQFWRWYAAGPVASS